MGEAYELADGKRSKRLVLLSIVFTVLFFFVFMFGRELCRTGFPLTMFVIGVPVVGTLAAIASLFNPRSTILVVIGKLSIAAINLCFMGLGWIALTGMELAKCG